MTKVTLHGALGEEVGAEWELLIDRPREAVAAIEANTGKLYRYLREAHQRSEGAIQYRFIVNGRDHEGIGELYLSGEFQTIDIVPVMAGAGGLSGLWQAIIGVVLIVVGVVLLFTGVGTALAPYVIMAGISLTLGGVAQMLTKQPTLGGNPALARNFKPTQQMLGQSQNEQERNVNYLFSGAQNTTQQGNPVPILYGELIVGSQLVSFGISGVSTDSAIIGDQRPPAANDTFLDDPIFDALAAQSRAYLVRTTKQIAQLKKQPTFDLAGDFDIPLTDPTTGKPIPLSTLKVHFLYTVSRLFNGPQRAITFKEAVNLYRVLGLTSIANLKVASWEEVVMALALHYNPP